MSRAGAVLQAYEPELPRVVGAVAVVWQAAVLSWALAYLPDYRDKLIPLAVWLGLLATAVWLVPRARSGRVGGRHAAAAIAIALAAVAALGLDRRPHVAGPVDWGVLGVGWLLALVAVSQPAWVWLSGTVLVFTVHAFMVARVAGLAPIGQARLVATGYTLTVIMAVFAALRPALRAHARSAARAALLASRADAERAASDAIARDRRERLALLEREALPLLRGIAGGDLDPAEAAVQERCARCAAALRQALVDSEPDPSGLMGALAPALAGARARGVPAQVQVIGTPAVPPAGVAQATAAVLGRVLEALPPHEVTLTLLEAAGEAELFLTFDRAPAAEVDLAGLGRSAPPRAGWVARLDRDENGGGALAVRWRTAEAA